MDTCCPYTPGAVTHARANRMKKQQVDRIEAKRKKDAVLMPTRSKIHKPARPAAAHRLGRMCHKTTAAAEKYAVSEIGFCQFGTTIVK